MVKINFIDCGAFDGRSAKKAKELYPDCKIYSFECNPVYIEELKKIPELEIIPKAVWIFDGYMKFYKGEPQAGTLIYGMKRYVNYKDSISVPCINFSAWVKQNLHYDDYNILKMNIEGAEYDILESLQKHHLLTWFREYWIEWHNDRIKGFPQSRHERINKLINWKLWTT